MNSYAAALDSVRVTVLSRVLLPTDGKPMSAIRASPDFTTSKPSPYENNTTVKIILFCMIVSFSNFS